MAIAISVAHALVAEEGPNRPQEETRKQAFPLIKALQARRVAAQGLKQALAHSAPERTTLMKALQFTAVQRKVGLSCLLWA